MKACSRFNVQLLGNIKLFVNHLTSLRLCSSVSRQINLDRDKESRVLSILNNSGKDELMRYPISKVRIEKIHRFKMKHGKIENIEELLQLDGFGLKMLEKMCASVLKHVDSPELPATVSQKRSGAFTIPAVAAASREHYKSVVSIFTTISTISWAHIKLNDNAPCDLTNWHCFELGEKRLHLSDLAQNLCQVVRMIPEADCYVMENPQIAQAAAPGGAELVNINVQKAQIVAMLNFGLASHNTMNFDHTRVFYLKKYLSSRIFNTLVGNERISTENVVTELMRTVYNVEDYLQESNESEDRKDRIKLRSNINFPMELRKLYSDAEKYQRDFLGQALLIGMTFTRLCLLRTPESVASITRKPTDELD